MDLVSGPDVGGGFLFQLTVERGEPFARFTVHAQEGGIDGGEPPAASPGTIGFEPVSPPCSIGGRHCWHRDYEVAPGRELQVRFAYNRLRFVIGAMTRHYRPDAPVPFLAGLRETMQRVVEPLRASRVPWMVGGSAAPFLLGAEVRPRDLDLSTTREGVSVIAEALGDMLVDPESRLRWGPGPARWGARAFVGTFKEGLAVEWAEAVPAATTPGPGALEWTSETLGEALPTRFADWEVWVAPPEIALVKSVMTDRPDRVEAIAPVVRARGPAWRLIDRLFDAWGASDGQRRSLTDRLGR